jgi:hypothetical protein
MAELRTCVYDMRREGTRRADVSVVLHKTRKLGSSSVCSVWRGLDLLLVYTRFRSPRGADDLIGPHKLEGFSA